MPTEIVDTRGLISPADHPQTQSEIDLARLTLDPKYQLPIVDETDEVCEVDVVVF